MLSIATLPSKFMIIKTDKVYTVQYLLYLSKVRLITIVRLCLMFCKYLYALDQFWFIEIRKDKFRIIIRESVID